MAGRFSDDQVRCSFCHKTQDQVHKLIAGPDTVTYSWWSYRFQARQRNAGWRLDYFMVSESLKDAVADAKIHTEILGSDHCPVELDLEV